MNDRLRTIAFYLPQFHPIPENDAWWGRGFTEWTNVTRAAPLFPGHYQPHLPTDLGFYDLRVPETRAAQAALAKEHGIDGFCYYHYWFNGRRILEKPFNAVLKSGAPDFPFCLCWANENWTRVWDGWNGQVLLEQHYSPEDDRRHLRTLVDAFRDPRYIRVDGKPLFLVYRVSMLPQPAQTAEVWREEAYRLGVGDLQLCTVESLHGDRVDPASIGFDAAIEFQPDWLNLGTPSRVLDQEVRVFDYATMIQRMRERTPANYRRYPCVTPSWDNTARRRKNAYILHNSTPDIYQTWLHEAIDEAFAVDAEEPLVFVNAWNEWAEGAHLEPDQKWGRGYLEATRRARERSLALSQKEVKPANSMMVDLERPAVAPTVSVCIPTYNGAAYLRETLTSILSQSLTDFELLVVDDCSSDTTESVVRSFDDPRITFVRNLSRLGLAGNWNRCLALARGRYVCIFHQDDVMEPNNLRDKVAVLEEHESVGLVYSNVYQIGARGEVLSTYWYSRPSPEDAGVRPGASFFRQLILGRNEVCCPSVVIRRDCVERLGGFDERLPFTADWEMWLRVSLHFDVAYLTEPLIRYRRHDANETLSFAGPHELDHYYMAKSLVLDKYPAKVEDADALRKQVAENYAAEALEQARLRAAAGDVETARGYLSRAVEFHRRAYGSPPSGKDTSWFLDAVDIVLKQMPTQSPTPIDGKQQPARFRPEFISDVSVLSGREIADLVRIRTILQAIAFKFGDHPAFHWARRLKPLAKRLLVR